MQPIGQVLAFQALHDEITGPCLHADLIELAKCWDDSARKWPAFRGQSVSELLSFRPDEWARSSIATVRCSRVSPRNIARTQRCSRSEDSRWLSAVRKLTAFLSQLAKNRYLLSWPG